MKKELQGNKESPEGEIHLESLRATPKNVLNREKPGHDGIYGFFFFFFKSHQFMINRFFNWLDSKKKEEYPNGWPRGKKSPDPERVSNRKLLSSYTTSTFKPKMKKTLKPHGLGRRSITRLYATDCFTKNRQDTTGESVELVIYYRLINSITRRIKWDEKKNATAWIDCIKANNMDP